MASTPNLSVQGVTLYCSGERKNNAHPEFELVSISPQSPIFSTPVCPISELVGIPIQIMRVYTEFSLNHSNFNATYLKIRLKEGSEPSSIINEVGWAPDEWQVPAGNVIAVRVDKKPMNIAIMQLLCDFCEVRMMRVLSEVSEREESAEQVQKIIKRDFNRKAFRAFGDEYKKREQRNGRDFDWISVFGTDGLNVAFIATVDSVSDTEWDLAGI
jgi:hypothetical protein